MLQLQLPDKSSGNMRILCLGAHCDDIEIGCGGTILRLIEESENLEFLWMVFCSDAERSKEGANGAGTFLTGASGKKIIIKGFRDGFLPYSGEAVKDVFLELEHEFAPDLIFTHCRNDLHQDHRLISELTWNSFRNHLILEYEIPKYDGDLGGPNVFLSLRQDICRRKVDYLLKSYPSQSAKHWFTEDCFFSLLRLRGMESKSVSRYAEAFYCRKILL